MTIHRRMLLGAGIGLGLLALGSGALMVRNQPVDMSVGDITHDPDAPVLGNPEGDLTIVEFFDYQCPFCKRDHDKLTELVRTDGNIRLVLKDWPIFGGASVLASQLVLGSISAGHYETANTALMATEAKLSADQVRQALASAGIDVEAAQESYRSDRPRWDKLMGRNARQAAELGLRGTPGFIIGRDLYAGALSETDLRNAVVRARRA